MVMNPENHTPPEAIDFLTPLIQTLFFLLLFVALILTATFWIRRLGQMRWNKESQTSDIEILERRSLSPKSALYLIEVKGKQILIGESAEGLTHIAQFSPTVKDLN